MLFDISYAFCKPHGEPQTAEQMTSIELINTTSAFQTGARQSKPFRLKIFVAFGGYLYFCIDCAVVCPWKFCF